MLTCVVLACILAQEAKKKNISNYELLQEYQTAANNLVMSAKGFSPKTPKKGKSRKRKSTQPDSDPASEWSQQSDSGTDSDPDGNASKRKRRRHRPTSAKKKTKKKSGKSQRSGQWTRCYAAPLSKLVEKNLSQAYSEKLSEEDQKTAAMYPFCQRVLRVYLRTWQKSGNSELHEDREKFILEAVQLVQKHQIRPADSGPFLGNDERAFKTLLSLFETALVMPPGRAEVGSEVRHVLTCSLQVYARYVRVRTCVDDACLLVLSMHAYLKKWMKQRLDNTDLISFDDAVQFPELEEALIMDMMKKGVKKGLNLHVVSCTC